MASDARLKMQRSSSSPAFVRRAPDKIETPKVGLVNLCSLGAPLVPGGIDPRSLIYHFAAARFSARLISKPFFTPRVGNAA